MNRGTVLLVAACLAVAGCQSLAGPARLVADLQVMGHPAAVGHEFNAALLGGVGTTVCIGDETVSVYDFPTPDAAINAAATIDRDDPSHVGNGIVEWIGPPRFWLRDRAIILYLGEDGAVDGALRNLLGRPFAEAVGPGRGVANWPACEPG